MKVVILCGGKGTRIRDISEEVPKPMIPIGDHPIVKHIMDIYSNHNYKKFILCLGYKSWAFKEYFMNYSFMSKDISIDLKNNSRIDFPEKDQIPEWEITLAQTGKNSETGSRIKKIEKYIGKNRFMITYGDGLGNINITELVKFHKSHGKLMTITSVRPPSRFGEMIIKGDRVESFIEKPQTTLGQINGGFFVCEPQIFEYLSDSEDCILEKKPLKSLAEDGQLMQYSHNGFWMPMDTSREYKLLNNMWDANDPPWLDN